MPTTIMSVIYGLVGGIVGAIVMGIIMMLTSGTMKTTPPKIIAEKMLKDIGKDKQFHFMVMSIWGIIYGLLVGLAYFANTWTSGLYFSLVPWAVLGVAMLPMAGAGFFGMQKEKKLIGMTLVLHLIWGLVLWGSYALLTTLLG